MGKKSGPLLHLDVCVPRVPPSWPARAKMWQKQLKPPSPVGHFTALPCLFQALLDNEDEEMQHNEGQERSSNNFNYGAYHSLEAVSVSEQVKIKVIGILGFVTPFLTWRKPWSIAQYP